MIKEIYEEIEFQPVPTEQYGRCPECHTDKSKIIWGWHGVYYDMICENGHRWTFKFNKHGVKL